jgi:hypothetical protein
MPSPAVGMTPHHTPESANMPLKGFPAPTIFGDLQENLPTLKVQRNRLVLRQWEQTGTPAGICETEGEMAFPGSETPRH